MSLTQEDERKILAPYSYILELPGKNVRGKLIDAFQLWLKAPVESVATIKSIVDELHNASLLVDDIEDSSELRRGRPVAHLVYGVPATINCANYVYFLSLQRCHALGNDKAMQVYIHEMLRLHEGQGLDLFWRDHCECPSEDEYVSMVQNKTGGLFRLAVGLIQACSGTTLDLARLVNDLSVYFQIRDDFVNLFDAKFMETKSFCEDLTEGKFSYPMIVAIRSHPGDTRLVNILKQKTKDLELKKYVVQYLRDCGAFDATRTKLIELEASIQQELARLGGNKILEGILGALHASVK